LIAVAKGTTAGRIESALGLFGILALAVTLAIAFQWNPWPDIRDWLQSRTGTLSEPATAWVERAVGQPSAAGITDRAVLLFVGDIVESRSRADGALLWRKDVDWAALAGTPTASVAILAKVDGRGFEAVDPFNGTVRWTAPDATGAWTFRDAVLAIECPKAGCAIVSRALGDGSIRFRIGLPGPVRALGGANSGLLDLRDPDDTFDDARGAAPRPLPRYLGFLLDHRLQVIDTSAGRRVREEDVPNDARSIVAGNRTVRISAAVRDGGGCRYTVIARDAGTGREAWRKEGYDLRTAGGAGCEPRRDPSGGGTVLIATRGDNRQVFLSAVDGRELAVAGAGETILGTDGEVGLIRTANGKKIRAVRLGRGDATAWSRDAPKSSRVGLTPYSVFVTDATGERLAALDAGTGQVKLDLNSGAVVLGVTAEGAVLGRGRSVGYISFGTTA
jgi:outer membrane protein assembly factor BamB